MPVHSGQGLGLAAEPHAPRSVPRPARPGSAFADADSDPVILQPFMTICFK